MKNRISHYFENPDQNQKKTMNSNNKFLHVEFEKFDPRIIQNVVKQNNEQTDEYDDDDSSSYGSSYGSPDSVSQKIIVSQDSQMLQTLNLWIGHCNIGITNKLVKLLEEVDGIETLDIISKYRFRVGIGKLFSEKTVKHSISDTINSYLDTKEGSKKKT